MSITPMSSTSIKTMLGPLGSAATAWSEQAQLIARTTRTTYFTELAKSKLELDRVLVGHATSHISDRLLKLAYHLLEGSVSLSLA